jgi:acetyltransferase-like isoleucine patch superfamily enzyme
MDNYVPSRKVIIGDGAVIGSNVRIWYFTQIREGVKIGNDVLIGKSVYVDSDVVIGNFCKIQNNVSIFKGVKIGNGVFVGPHVCFTNDMWPRAMDDEEKGLRLVSDWVCVPTDVRDGVSIGANSTIRCGVTLGERCMIGCGSVVLTDVPAGEVWAGNPARKIGVIKEKK